MSITFTCPAAARIEAPCRWCAKELADGDIEEGEHCSPWCDGTETESVAPEPNFSNSNAYNVLDLLGFSGIYGSTDGATLRQRILKARNIDRSELVEAPYSEPGGHAGVQVTHEGNVAHMQRMGAATISFGNTDEQTLRRLAQLEELAIWAADHDLEITWG